MKHLEQRAGKRGKCRLDETVLPTCASDLFEGCGVDAGSCGRPDTWAERLSQKERQAMALTLQAQVLADAAKVSAPSVVFIASAVASVPFCILLAEPLGAQSSRAMLYAMLHA